MNDLLIWMSARERGSWSQFRAAVEELHLEPGGAEEDGDNTDAPATGDLPAYQAVRLDLQRLGHVEFFSSTAGAEWRVVPPALAVHRKGDQYVGILCGARPPDLLDRLAGRGVALDSQAAPGMPDRIRLTASDFGQLLAVAKAAGVYVQMEAPTCLLAAIPPVDDPRSRVPAEPPAVPGWIIDRFSTSTLRWIARDPAGETGLGPEYVRGCQTGLFRFRMKYQRFHYLRWQGRTYRIPAQVGKYAILRYRRVRRLLQYDRASSLLSVPISCRPPLLVERALILCTGLLPGLDRATARLQYTAPVLVARLAGGLLRQEIAIS